MSPEAIASVDLSARVSRTGGREATAGTIAGRWALSVGMPDLPCPEGWRWTPLSTVAQLESGHTPSRRHPEYWDEGIPWIGIKDAVDGHGRTIIDTYQHVSNLGLANSSARLLPARTVCLSRTASVGYVVVMGRSMATSQDFVNWVCGPSLIPEYLKYILFAERDSLLRFASGTTHQTIYYPEAKAFHALLPPVDEQRAILSIVGALDDKIDLIRRMNETLEELAKTIFKSWFVDFDPVRAKVEGRQPVGMDPETAAMFPGRLVDSGLGPTPEGWRVGDVYSLGEVDYGAPYASGRFNSQQVGRPLIRIRDLKSQSPDFWTDELHPREILVSPGDVLVGMDGEFRAYLWFGETAVLNQRVCRFRPLRKQDATYLRFAIQAPLAFIERTEVGTTVIHLGKADIDQFRILRPSAAVLDRFAEIVVPISARVIEAAAESRTLSSLRDTLLPKLISGELRIKDAEKLAEAVL